MKLSKVFSIIAVVVMLLGAASNVVLALNPGDITVNSDAAGTSALKTLGGNIIGIIQTVGSIASIIVLIVLGVKYMMGSAEEKAEYKKTMIPYVVGAVLIFAASNIAGIVFSMAGGITES